MSLFACATASSSKHKTYRFWQEGNHAMELYSEKFIWDKINYIHQNPVKEQFVSQPEYWQYSSATNYAGLPSLLHVETLTPRLINTSENELQIPKCFLFRRIANPAERVTNPRERGKKVRNQKWHPRFAKGYYLNLKGDSVRGEIQTNPESELDFYKNILFKAPGASKVTVISPKKAKGYGFNGRHFVIVPYDAQT